MPEQFVGLIQTVRGYHSIEPVWMIWDNAGMPLRAQIFSVLVLHCTQASLKCYWPASKKSEGRKRSLLLYHWLTTWQKQNQHSASFLFCCVLAAKDRGNTSLPKWIRCRQPYSHIPCTLAILCTTDLGGLMSHCLVLQFSHALAQYSCRKFSYTCFMRAWNVRGVYIKV